VEEGKAEQVGDLDFEAGMAVFWSPRNKVREARARESVRQQEEQVQKLQKARDRELKEAANLYKQMIAEEKRVAREAAKRERDREEAIRAEEAAERRRQKEAEKQAATAAKSLQLSQRGKRPASKPPAQRNKRVKRCGGVASDEVGGGAASLPPPKITRRGRNINLPSKYK
jgi:hypothetical protein